LSGAARILILTATVTLDVKSSIFEMLDMTETDGVTVAKSPDRLFITHNQFIIQFFYLLYNDMTFNLSRDNIFLKYQPRDRLGSDQLPEPILSYIKQLAQEQEDCPKAIIYCR
jgi:superfamily II DNA helicase RecQ